jgi:hypothetical protein
LTVLDHLVVAARTLDEGAAWIEQRLGVKTVAGGKHATMGTHNRLLKLDAGRYLEVISIDPEAPPPARPRWFELDTAPMKARLAEGPALIHWVERTDDLEAAVRASGEPVELVSFSRGPYRWRMGLPRDGSLPGRGARATLIQWEGAHPWDALPETGVSLLEFRPERRPLSATFVTAAGPRTIP